MKRNFWAYVSESFVMHKLLRIINSVDRIIKSLSYITCVLKFSYFFLKLVQYCWFLGFVSSSCISKRRPRGITNISRIPIYNARFCLLFIYLFAYRQVPICVQCWYEFLIAVDWCSSILVPYYLPVGDRIRFLLKLSNEKSVFRFS